MAVTLDVIKNFGTIGQRKSNNLELRLVSWNNNPPKYDLRGWYIDSRGVERCTKGMTFSEDELFEVMEIVNSIDLTDKTEQIFGTIQSGKNETRVSLSKYGYGIGLYGGKYIIKGVTMSEDEIVKLKEVVAELDSGSDGRVGAPKSEQTAKVAPTSQKAMDPIVKSLTSIPVNDCNYPLDKATIAQLEEAISIMESDTKGKHKTRIARCKAKLTQLRRKNFKVVQPVATTETADKDSDTTEEVVDNDNSEVTSESTSESTPSTETADSQTVKAKVATGKNIIQFPQKDTTQIVKLTPTGENHSYAEAEAKLNEERKLFKGDRDSEYVIDGILELCKSDQEFLDNVMRPEKSYSGALQYFANKARQGYCIKVDNIGIMSADTALKYAIDYFNSEEPKKPEPKTVKTNTSSKTKSAAKRGAAKKSAPKRK